MSPSGTEQLAAIMARVPGSVNAVDSSPDSISGAGSGSGSGGGLTQANGQGHGQTNEGIQSTAASDHRTSNNGGRKRIRRACDKCSKSRTRCDGDFPCLHCTNYGFSCSYDREQRPRGRASTKRLRVFDTTSPALNDGQGVDHKTNDASNISEQAFTANGTSVSGEGRHQTQTHSTDNHTSQRSNSSRNRIGSQEATTSSNFNQPVIHNPRPEHQNYPDYLQDMIGTPNFQSFYFDDATLNNFPHLDYYGNAIQGMPAAIYSTSSMSNDGNPVNDFDSRRTSATPRDRPRTISRIGFVVPGTPQFRPQSAFGKSTSGETPSVCRYMVLVPLLQHINHIISPSIACHLLDLYFAEPSSSLFESASPYVLTHIFRKKTFLHTTKPRKTSPALLAAMLWATAQTSDASIFKTAPTSRARVCDRLFAVCLRLLNPMLHETPRRASLDQLSVPERSHNGNVRDGMQSTGTLDDVLTLTLIGIVISGGDFKHDCGKWWRATWALAKELKLGQEVDDNAPTTLGNADPTFDTDPSATSGTSHASSTTQITEEEKEERRRAWWLLFIADRHLALSFNGPLHIFEAECHLYQPLDDATWQEQDPEIPKERFFGPQTTCTGIGLFEFFLPLMVILGDIVEIHHRSYHPRFGALENNAAIKQVEALLEAYEQSLKNLEPQPSPSRFGSGQNSDFQARRLPSIHQLNNQFVLPLSPASLQTQTHTPKQLSNLTSRKQIVLSYSTHILHVMHILLHGKWDPLSMLDDLDNWTTSPSFLKCASHSVSAAEAVSQILNHDPELSFMPYLFGIYLLHGSFILLLFADKMQIEANPTVRLACETMIRAHEVCVATLNTEYQRNFRKVLRSALYDARGIVSIDTEDQRVKRREFLSLYRWANNGVGLAL